MPECERLGRGGWGRRGVENEIHTGQAAHLVISPLSPLPGRVYTRTHWGGLIFIYLLIILYSLLFIIVIYLFPSPGRVYTRTHWGGLR